MPRFALGCARIGSLLTPLDRGACIALIEEAYDLGVRHFDTASVYGQGDSERYIGEALHGHRDKVVLASKAGQRLPARQLLMAHFKPALRWVASHRRGLRERIAVQRHAGIPRCFEPDYVEQSLHASLRRLRTDYLDIFYLHSPSVAALDDERLFARIRSLRERGMFRLFGVSCDDHEVARRAATHDAVQVVQFAFDDSAGSDELLAELARRGKRAVVRGFRPPSARGAHAHRSLDAQLHRALHYPAVGDVILGTTNPSHLRANYTAYREALAACER